MRTPQQRTGDAVEEAALKICLEYFSGARLTKGSGNVHGDGDIEGIPALVDCKGSEKPGKGRSVSKKDWAKIKQQARRWQRIPVHVGFDDDGELIAFVPFDDLMCMLRSDHPKF